MVRDEPSVRLGVLPAYTRLFDALVHLLVREGYLRADGDHLIVTRLAEARMASLGDVHPEVAVPAAARPGPVEPNRLFPTGGANGETRQKTDGRHAPHVGRH